MEKISGLSDDELLVKILSYLPTKVAVSTSILSKRWKHLWKHVPRLDFSDRDSRLPNKWQNKVQLRRFIHQNLSLHRAPVLESLCLKFSTSPFQTEDIELWVDIAVSQGVRELSIAYSPPSDDLTTLPSRLYNCESLVSLKLDHRIRVDVPHTVFLPSLKSLLLRLVEYKSEKSLQDLVSNCPVLEDLTVERYLYDNGGEFAVISSSMQRLNVNLSEVDDSVKVVINSPSLKYFKATDIGGRDVLRFIENMPSLEEADIDTRFYNIRKYLTPITSVKRLSLCLKLYIPKPLGKVGIIFRKLEYLKLCTCDLDWSNLLFRFLRDSHNLKHLELYIKDEHVPDRWDEELLCQRQMYVPKCHLIGLETFKWTGYGGTSEERDIMTFIFNNAFCLKTATMVTMPYFCPQDKEDLLYDLRLIFRLSPTCKITVD